MKKIKSCFNGYFPSELWAEIISYLPVKVLLRFRSVSRLWKSMIGNSNFISLHLKHSPNNVHNPSLILCENVERVRPRNYRHRWVIRHSKTYREVSEEIEFPNEDPFRWKICGEGVDGLILLLGLGYHYAVNVDIILWNPSIHKSIHLHPPPLPDPWIQSGGYKGPRQVGLCLLFDASSDDYKVIMIHCRYSIVLKSISAPLIDVFSLKSCSWRRIEVSHKSLVRMPLWDYSTTATVIGGSAHWIGVDHLERMHSQFQVRKLCVTSFNLNSNMLSFTPTHIESKEAQRWKVIVLPESTLGILLEFRYEIIIWAKERSSVAFDGSECCWSIRYQINIEKQANLIGEVPEIFYVAIPPRKLGVLLWGSKSFQSHDLDTNELKVLLKSYSCLTKYIGTYKESLLLLEHEGSPGMARDFAEDPRALGI